MEDDILLWWFQLSVQKTIHKPWSNHLWVEMDLYGSRDGSLCISWDGSLQPFTVDAVTYIYCRHRILQLYSYTYHKSMWVVHQYIGPSFPLTFNLYLQITLDFPCFDKYVIGNKLSQNIFRGTKNNYSLIVASAKIIFKFLYISTF